MLDDNDKIIRLADRLKSLDVGEDFTIVFPEIDADCDFEHGTTKRLLARTLKIAELEIVFTGNETAKLRHSDGEISQRISSFDW